MSAIKNVAIVGAGGRSGGFIAKYLLETGKHTVTALTRKGSSSTLPAGTVVKEIDYADADTIVDALRGQDALIITLSVQAPEETNMILVSAAIEAGVSWIMPNEWGPDNADASVRKDIAAFESKGLVRDAIAASKSTKYISLVTGFWYEWSLAFPLGFGFDIENRKVLFYDDGNIKICTSTWPQVGRAVAAILSLPATSTTGPSLESYANRLVYVKSFTISQREMFASLLRTTETKESDWTVTQAPARELYAAGVAELQAGNRSGFVKLLYTRIFFDDGNGNFEAKHGVRNSELGLPEEDLDEATRIGISRADNPAQ